MINIEELSIFQQSIDTLMNTSLDDREKGIDNFMVSDKREVYDFDKVKNIYIKNLKLCDTPKSNDALLVSKRGKLIFIEFKNGSIKGYELSRKIYDSIIILTDILQTYISEIKDDLEYVLVYNEDVNLNLYQDNVTQKKGVQSSKAFNSINNSIHAYAKKEPIYFGLNRFTNYCFSKVHTYTVHEFEEFLKEI